MTNKNKTKLQPPMQFTKQEFIDSSVDQEDEKFTNKGRSQAVTFTLNGQDIEILEQAIDRAIQLGKRNKSKSAIIRMALRALQASSDDNYLYLYNKF